MEKGKIKLVLILFIILFSVILVLANLSEDNSSSYNLTIVNETSNSTFENQAISAQTSFQGENYQAILNRSEREKRATKENSVIDYSSFELIDRKENSDIYYDKEEDKFMATIYPIAVNMKDFEGNYKPYEEVTRLSYDNNSLVLSWNNKTVRFNLYTKDESEQIERFENIDSQKKANLDFRTSIEKRRGGYYFNHTMTEDKVMQPKKLGYEIEAENVSCYAKQYSLICDEQQIDFREAVEKQNLSVEIDENYIEFSGGDLSYIDPTVSIDVEDPYGDYGRVEYQDDGDYVWHNNSFYYIGSYEGATDRKIRGYVIFGVHGINDDAIITGVKLYLYIEDTDDGDCDEGVSNFIDFYKCNEENIDESPDDESEEAALWDYLDDDWDIGWIEFNNTENYWASDTLNSYAKAEVQSLIDGDPTNQFMIGLVQYDEEWNTDCWVTFQGSISSKLPYIIVDYIMPDEISPTTSIAGNFSDDGKPYILGTLGNRSVNITLSCLDTGGDPVSGCDFTKYCTDIFNLCEPNVTYSTPVTISTEGVSYIRYYSKDKSNNQESTHFENIVIDSNPLSPPIKWPECNPADPCCDVEGYLREEGYICKSAHDAVCDDSNSSGCDGHAYEDRCDGTSSLCPDNNYEIDYDDICTRNVCLEQSCSGYTLQPERTCSANICQINEPYDCPNNLECLDGTSCKTNASSSSDCKTSYEYDTYYKVCKVDQDVSYGMVYDKNGNLISGFDLNYSYNNFNQLVNLTDSSSGSLIAEYFYDYEGTRIKSIIYQGGENTTVYYFDNFIQLVNSSGVYNESYFYYYDKLIGKKNSDGSIFFYHVNLLGSNSLVTNSSGDVVAFLSYEPFGGLIGDSNERYTYTGHEQDQESNLLYMKARYYDPDIGKFIQPDSITQDIFDPQNLNRYSYVRNNPYRYIDPEGLWMISMGGALSGAVEPVYGSIAGKIYIIHDETKGISSGWHIGGYLPLTGGGAMGDAGSATITASYSPDVNHPEDLKGISASVGGSGGYKIAVGFDVSALEQGVQEYTLHRGVGIGVEFHTGVTKTFIADIFGDDSSSREPVRKESYNKPIRSGGSTISEELSDTGPVRIGGETVRIGGNQQGEESWIGRAWSSVKSGAERLWVAIWD